MIRHVARAGVDVRKKIRVGLLRILSLAGLCLLLGGCVTLLPTARGKVIAPWNSFVEAQNDFARIVANKTTRADLRDLNFEPFSNPNIEILSYLDLTEKFMPNASFLKQDLPAGVRECLAVQDRCSGYQLVVNSMESQRYGNVVLDLFNFKRITKQNGWSFKALVVLEDDLVVYKLYGGKPLIQESQYRKNPLGPLQESGDLLRSVVVETSID